MSKPCFYDVPDCSRRLSREHVISETVLKAIFGDPVRNLVWAELLGDRQIADHQQVIKDVCTSCNSRLSVYDSAGVDFVNPLLNVCTADGLVLPITQLTLGWLLKTHLNYFHLIRDHETNEQYSVDGEIKHSLVARKLPPMDKFALFIDGFEGTPYFWDPDDERRISWFSYKSFRFYAEDVVLSEFRLKCVYTTLLLPRNNNYSDFDSRVQSVVNKAWSYFKIRLRKADLQAALAQSWIGFPAIVRFDSTERSIRLWRFAGPPRNL